MNREMLAFLRERLDEDADEAARGYLTAPEIPGYQGWDKGTTAGLRPAVAARVLREVEVKRSHIATYEIAMKRWSEIREEDHDQPEAVRQETAVNIWASIIQDDVQPYRGHPAFRDWWAT